MEVVRPQSLIELTKDLCRMSPKSEILAGGTDLVIALNKGEIAPDLLIDLSGLEEFSAIKEEDGAIYVGAGVTFSEIENSRLIGRYYTSLIDAAKDIGSKQIRNRGTIGGNIANSSPAGDMIPPLVSLDASVITVNSKNVNKEILISDLITGVGKNILAYDEAILYIKIPVPQREIISRFMKIGNRRMVTIARLSIAVRLSFDEEKKILNAVVALGAVGKTVFRAHMAEAVLVGNKVNDDMIELFANALSKEVEQSIPNRYSLPYKKRAVKGIAYDIMNSINSGKI